ncbi:hypothetical protein FHG87_012740 [Trinorchestia longiramus]|nr:hypothetical protein FHG87_012740 [Trinorchestia longiramus]
MRIREEIAAIPLEMCRRVTENFIHRLQQCIAADGHHLSDAIVKKHDFIKQEAAVENFVHVDTRNPVKEVITVKEDPIDWDQEPQTNYFIITYSSIVQLPKSLCSMDCTASKNPTVVVHELPDAEVKRLCCRHDFIKQEAAVENFVHVDTPNTGKFPQAMTIKKEIPDDELDDITVKEEPIDWNQEPQVSSSAVSSAVIFKREVDEACVEVHAGPTEAENKVKEGGSGACNTGTVHPQSARASQESADLLAPDVFCVNSDVEVRPPDGLVTQPVVCELCDSATVRKDSLTRYLCSEHKLGVSSKTKSELSGNSCVDLIGMTEYMETKHTASTMSAAGFEPGSFCSQADSLTSRPSW